MSSSSMYFIWKSDSNAFLFTKSWSTIVLGSICIEFHNYYLKQPTEWLPHPHLPPYVWGPSWWLLTWTQPQLLIPHLLLPKKVPTLPPPTHTQDDSSNSLSLSQFSGVDSVVGFGTGVEVVVNAVATISSL